MARTGQDAAGATAEGRSPSAVGGDGAAAGGRGTTGRHAASAASAASAAAPAGTEAGTGANGAAATGSGPGTNGSAGTRGSAGTNDTAGTGTNGTAGTGTAGTGTAGTGRNGVAGTTGEADTSTNGTPGTNGGARSKRAAAPSPSVGTGPADGDRTDPVPSAAPVRSARASRPDTAPDVVAPRPDPLGVESLADLTRRLLDHVDGLGDVEPDAGDAAAPARPTPFEERSRVPAGATAAPRAEQPSPARPPADDAAGTRAAPATAPPSGREPDRPEAREDVPSVPAADDVPPPAGRAPRRSPDPLSDPLPADPLATAVLPTIGTSGAGTPEPGTPAAGRDGRTPPVPPPHLNPANLDPFGTSGATPPAATPAAEPAASEPYEAVPPPADALPADERPADEPPPASAARNRRRELSAATLLPPPAPVPSAGWRRAVYKVTGGTVNPGLSARDQERADLTEHARAPLAGCHRVAVVSLKGGVGKTTTTVGLGATLASLRGDRVIAVDASPDRGTLGVKVPRSNQLTVRQLLDSRGDIQRYVDVRRFVSQADSRLEVLASDEDPEVSQAFSDVDYRAVDEILERYYSIIVTDCGPGMLHSAMDAVLSLTDALVIVSTASVDGASSASATLDWLDAHGYGDLARNSITVISTSFAIGPQVDVDLLEKHFAARTRQVVRVPYDNHLAGGGFVDLPRLHPNTADAYLRIGAAVVDKFGTAG